MKKILIGMVVCSLALTSCKNQAQRPEYSGADLTGKVQVERDQVTKAATVRMDVPGEWKVYAGPTVESIDLSRPVLQGKTPGTFPVPVPDSVRSYFLVETEDGKALLAERHLPMTGGFNFRDLGGFRTKNDKYVKWGMILRSDDMHNLTEADLRYLASVPLRSVVDFRSGEEIELAQDVIPGSSTGYIYSISPGNLMEAVTGIDPRELTEGRVDSLMMQLNEVMVTDPASIEQYRKFFGLLQNESNIPLMFHCSAGKDRTGMGAMLVLSALGVSEETIMQDYLLSNDYLKEKYGQYSAQYPQLAGLFGVKREFLQAGIDRIKADHGSVEKFLEDVLEVDIRKFREIYLY